jgi:pimeloyl-ACP methyl ester carboxylesterase
MKAISIASIFLLLLSCRDDIYYEGDFFYLVNKGAQMPVSVRGNIDSGILILFLHGGPGGTALQKVGLPAFVTLEKSYGVVYWDQRASGSSQGNSKDEYLSLAQFTEDLEKLVDLIRFKYDTPTIFLMGHSWGGCLGTSYLTDSGRQEKIRGWIEIDGAHNNPKADSLSMAWITAYADEQIASHVDKPFWSFVKNWYIDNPNFTTDQLEHYAFVDKANGYIYDPSLQPGSQKFPNYSFAYIFDSPANVTAALTNYSNVIEKFIVSDIDLTPQMKKITLPTLVIWGLHDGIIPYPMATHAINALGTVDSDKSLVTLSSSAHNGFYEEPEVFADAVITFIKKYQ